MNIWRRGWVFPIIAVGLWGFISIVVGTIYPAVIQKFQVQPNELTKEQLDKYRKRAAADSTGAPLAAIVAKLEKTGYGIGGEALKRVPAGWPQDHPRARLLRHKILYIYKNFGLQPWLGSNAARKHIVKVWGDAEPLNDWLKRNAG